MKILGSEITPYKTYLNRRQFIQSSFVSATTFALASNLYASHNKSQNQYSDQLSEKDVLNTYEEITTYNNFYEFGTGKTDPANNSDRFQTVPWSIKVEGLINKPNIRINIWPP